MLATSTSGVLWKQRDIALVLHSRLPRHLYSNVGLQCWRTGSLKHKMREISGARTLVDVSRRPSEESLSCRLLAHVKQGHPPPFVTGGPDQPYQYVGLKQVVQVRLFNPRSPGVLQCRSDLR